MAIVIFYEKPGCIRNTMQKSLLAVVGHTVQAHAHFLAICQLLSGLILVRRKLNPGKSVRKI